MDDKLALGFIASYNYCTFQIILEPSDKKGRPKFVTTFLLQEL